MTLGDIPQVLAIDQLSFRLPWSANSYRRELTENRQAHFWVAIAPALRARGWLAGWRPSATRRVVGYAGFWLVVDEAHVNTLAVHPDWRGQGVGERLLATLLGRAVELRAVAATLEVRLSNTAAQNLYRKYGFEEAGRRARYYRDNAEDALIMTAALDAACRARIAAGLRRGQTQSEAIRESS